MSRFAANPQVSTSKLGTISVEKTMYRFAVLASVVCLASSPSLAANVQFFGRFHFTAGNATCVAISDIQDPLFMRFAPPNLGTNGPQTRLTTIGRQTGDNWTLASGSLAGTTYKTVTATGMGFSAGQIVTKMRITSQVPATLTATTPSVILKGNVQNYAGDTGCTIGFTAVGYLK
jgi:hypothetical protein